MMQNLKDSFMANTCTTLWTCAGECACYAPIEPLAFFCSSLIQYFAFSKDSGLVMSYTTAAACAPLQQQKHYRAQSEQCGTD
jgi:hypothetical protein